MSEVLIPYGDDASETARRLLAAAEDSDLSPLVVRHQPDDGGFRVPEEVAAAAGFGEPDDKGDNKADEEPKPKKTAKKAAKKTASNG